MSNANFLVKKWKKHLSEKIDPQSINISALEVQDSLNSDVWEDEDFINSDIKRNLERIARDFMDSLGIPAHIDDIVITGSIANYNWSRFSDIDVHILVDFDEIDENHDLVREMFQKAHAHWNRLHNIKVNDHEVEIYVQDIDEPHHSSGIYSILGDKWVKKPKKDEFTLNKDEIQSKSAHLMDDIDEIEQLLDNNNFEQAFDDAGRLKEKIRNFRRGGLEKGGEYSSENLSFKILRRNGYLERLSSMQNEAYDKMMSLEEHLDDKIDFDLDPTDIHDKIPKKDLRTLGAGIRITLPRHKSLERIHGDNFSFSAGEFADEWDSLKSSEERDDELDIALDKLDKSKEKDITKIGFLQGKPIRKEPTLSEAMADLKRVKKKYEDDPAMSAAINRMETNDPSGNHKYMNWFVKQLEKNPITAELIIGMVDSIQRFHRLNHLFKKRDIAQFATPEELRSAAGLATDEFQRREYEKKHHKELSTKASEESSMLFDGKVWNDGTEEAQEMPFTIVRPDSEHASCWHGRGTTWCISATEAQNYFDYYTGQGKVFYIVMDKTRKDRDKYKKVAWIGTSSGIESQFDASQPDHAPMTSGLAREKIIDSVLKKLTRRGQTDEEHVYHVEQAEAFADRLQSKIAEHLKENPPESGYEEKVQDILERFRPRMDWVMIDANVEDHGDGEAVTMYATARMRFDNPEPVKLVQNDQMPRFLGKGPAHEEETIQQIKAALLDNYDENVPASIKLDVRTMVGSEHAPVFVVDLYYEPDAMARPQVPPPAPTPEGFEVFCLVMERIDDNFAETRLLVRKILVADDYVEPNAFDKHAAGYEEADFDSTDTDEDYHYVAISYEPDAHEIEMLIPLNVPREIWDTFEKRVEYNIVSGYSEISKLNDASRKVLNTTLQQMLSKQGEPPGLEDEPLSAGLDMNVRGYIPSSLEIELNGAATDKDVEDAYRIARVIDNNFEEFKKVYIENIKNYGEVRAQPADAIEAGDEVFQEEHIAETTGRPKVNNQAYVKTGYQKIARRLFGKAMRLTVKGPQRTMPKGWKVINPVPGKSGPPGE